MKAEIIMPWNRQTIVLRRIPKRTVVRWIAALLAAIATGGWVSMKTVRGPAAPNPTGAALQQEFVAAAAKCASPTPDGAPCPPANTVQLPRMTIDQVFMELSRHSR